MGRVSKVSISRAAIVLTVMACGTSGVMGATAAFAEPAPTPVNVTCGEIITTSITVANNLTCPGDALSIQADGVTLDLGGHTIRGSGSGVGVRLYSTVSPDISNVTVTNGTITHFGSAVELIEAINPTLSDLTLSYNSGTARPVIDTGRGGPVDGLLVTNTRITHTPGDVIFAQVNVGAVTFANTRISGGTVFFSQSAGPLFSNDSFAGTSVTLNIEGSTTITGSKFVNSPVLNNGFGFGHDVFKNNTFSGSGTALTIADVPTQQINHNTFSGNNIGVSLIDSPNDTLADNTFTHNRTAGIYFVDNNGLLGPGSLTVSGNTARYNGASPDGTTDPGGVAVAGGIFLYTPNGGATITDNKTAHNGGYGIYALPPTPPGMNTASGNVSIGNANQCFPLTTCTY